MADLPTNLKDDILNSSVNTRRKYRMIENEDGTYSFEDLTEYNQVGDEYGAGLINETNKQVNARVEKAVVVRDLETIGAITQPGFIPDALALKDVNDSLGGFEFYVEQGKAYYKPMGADSGIPFSSTLFFENLPCTLSNKDSTNFYNQLTFSIADVYPNYKNITPTNVIVRAKNGIQYEDTSKYTFSYEPSTGIFTISISSYGFSKVTSIDVAISL